MRFRPHPTEADLDVLVSLVDDHLAPDERRWRLGEDETYLEHALDQPRALASVASLAAPRAISPWLMFALYLRQASRDLETSPPIPDWTGPHEVVPVLDASVARAALADKALRAELERLLTAFARLRPRRSIAVREAGRRREIAMSDLDPDSLAPAVAYSTPEVAGDLLHRMADAYLFLAGLYPEHVVTTRGREIGAWEQAGQGLYRAAAARYEDSAPEWTQALEDMAAAFHGARRALNFMRERHLASAWPTWFEAARRGA